VVFTNDCIRFPVANTLTVIRLFRALINYKTPYEAFEELTGVDIKNLLGYALMT
jgi:hypothetical protein